MICGEGEKLELSSAKTPANSRLQLSKLVKKLELSRRTRLVSATNALKPQ